MLWPLCVFVLCRVVDAAASAPGVKPNIVIILADDLGFNDVGFHGSNQIPTPNIDALAYSGLVLHNYYVTPICTPSRAALMTGKYPIHLGMQHGVIYGAEPRGLPLSEKIMPQYFKDLGYKTHLVGKWHLGHYKKEYLPMNRGFDSHLGFWTGKIDMYDHTNMEKGMWGSDFRRGIELAHDLFGEYATDVYSKEAVKIIKAHNKTSPLFLMVSHSAVHSGNPSEYLRAPDYLINNFSYIEDLQRRKFAAILTKLDESVGKVVQALQKRGMLANSIILFSTDNGGAAGGFNNNSASNYPLKGVKNTLWEGGVRGAGLLWSPLLHNRSRVHTEKLHITDWLPTLHYIAGGNNSVFKNLDGMNLWESLTDRDGDSNRRTIVHNIDDIWHSAAITIEKWKVIIGTNYGGAWDGWYGPDDTRKGNYSYDLVRSSNTGVAIAELTNMPSEKEMAHIREMATVICDEILPIIPCSPLEGPCLYDLNDDPCERQDLSRHLPDVLQKLLVEFDKVNKTVIPPNNKPLEPDANPKYWGQIFVNYGDYMDLKRPNDLCPIHKLL